MTKILRTSKRRNSPRARSLALAKCPTGIKGLDEITAGGLPRGRPTLVCGAAGCGKTLLAMEFLVRGATLFGEPGVFFSFEESEAELAANVASLGFDLPALVRRKSFLIDHVRIERSEIQETGEYDLEGLFVRLGYAIDSIGARRVVLDTLETLFAGLPSEVVLRSELRRLFRWLKDRGVTAVITAERGREQLTRHGLEEYVSDCVIVLDHKVAERIATRHLRVVKYRGTLHGTNEYPFLIGNDGLTVMPITSLGLGHTVSRERISTGIVGLDAMLGGTGFYRGSSVLLTGSSGTGKTSVAAHFARAAAQRGERALFFAFEESPGQITRDMRSIDLRLDGWMKRDLLRFHSSRPTLYGLEMHLATMFKEVQTYRPAVVVVDPITSLLAAGSESEAKAMVTRLIDFLKGAQITSLFTSLSGAGDTLPHSEITLSSLMDSWLLLKDVEGDGERNRVLYVLKSRGMEHSNQMREFLITSRGIDLVDAYIGPGGVLTGSARTAQVARERTAVAQVQQELANRRSVLASKRAMLESQITALRAQQEEGAEENRHFDEQAGSQLRWHAAELVEMARMRHSNGVRSARAQDEPTNGNGR